MDKKNKGFIFTWSVNVDAGRRQTDFYQCQLGFQQIGLDYFNRISGASAKCLLVLLDVTLRGLAVCSISVDCAHLSPLANHIVLRLFASCAVRNYARSSNRNLLIFRPPLCRQV